MTLSPLHETLSHPNRTPTRPNQPSTSSAIQIASVHSGTSRPTSTLPASPSEGGPQRGKRPSNHGGHINQSTKPVRPGAHPFVLWPSLHRVLEGLFRVVTLSSPLVNPRRQLHARAHDFTQPIMLDQPYLVRDFVTSYPARLV